MIIFQVSGELDVPWSFSALSDVPTSFARDEYWKVNTRFIDGDNPYYKMVSFFLIRTF